MPSVLAIAAHPDDIEFVMAGAMLQLARRGWDLHYVNLCDGSRGSTTMDRETCAAVRLEEARNAAKSIGATFYPPIYPDMEATYNTANVRKVAAIIRMAKPTIVLTHSPIDYMEDHETACRLAVTAAFTHGMPNFESDPELPVYMDPVTVYHAQPPGHRTPLGELITPHLYVDETDVIEQKVAALACHASQKQWLDESQGMDSYLQTLRDSSAQMGRMSGKFSHAEGWRRREHWGFCGPDDDPLRDALSDIIVDTRSARS
ncbi:1D-myo-inositol 2-acetamido-2-deoxy-alpha-D-glucopyranoside deacetylase [Novipirellula galeiformis]|uniref:1D-myo-inositol 2-acetamido-2-deoxy-alpha-D-glucopyranoside deacetylase n=1 Tax=Novipirellula galeiformis TaxID=2528004 RepID=A0A5C6C9S4_9BACT|nr:PIG-L family deacetylase [Novipirellula galeiformis]TWU21483.1 1D-myo-inositol 2-acetamido-2-deoxy-alpha-D-glucopyranoside deacetylase [Novipirellula galeiformis]